MPDRSLHAPADSAELSPSPDGHPCVFAIVEESWRRAILKTQLAALRLPVQFFSSPQAYCDNFEERGGGCIIYDAPSASGAAEMLRRLHSMLVPPIIYITADVDTAIVVQVMKQGAVDFLSRRTYDDTDLCDAIRRAFDHDGKRRTAVADSRERRTRFESLSQADRDVLRRLLLGYSNAAVAAALDITEAAAEGRRIRLMKKLRVKNFTSLIRFVIESGFEADL